MAPVLILFPMSAFAETLETEWKNTGIGVCTVRSVIGEKLLAGEGKLRGHLPKDYLSQRLTAVEILQYLYDDDGAFTFASRTDLKKGLTLIHKHFERLGLEMHIGRGENPSKTERICPSGGSIGRIWSRFGVGVRSFLCNWSVRNGGVPGESSVYFCEASRRFSTKREWDWQAPDAC